MGQSPFRSRLRWNAAVVVLQQVSLTPSIVRPSAAHHLDSTSQGQQEWPDFAFSLMPWEPPLPASDALIRAIPDALNAIQMVAGSIATAGSSKAADGARVSSPLRKNQRLKIGENGLRGSSMNACPGSRRRQVSLYIEARRLGLV